MTTTTVDVSTLATGGSGTPSDPYTGWDASTNWSLARDYYFPQAYYQAAENITVPLKSRIRGAGRELSVIQTTTSYTGALFTVSGTPNGSTDASVLIESISLQNTNYTQSAAIHRNTAIAILCCSYCLVRDVRTVDWWAGVIWDQAEVCWLENCDLVAMALFGSSTTTAPTAVVIAQAGTTGTTQYAYQVCAVDANGHRSLAAVNITDTGNATLSGTNNNAISWTASAGAVTYEVYRILGGGSSGQIGAVSAPTVSFTDTGISADNTKYPPTPTRNLWIVGGPEYVFGHIYLFSAALYVRACNFNGAGINEGDAFHIVDDGGPHHVIRDCQFNGNYTAIRSQGGEPICIKDNYFEGQNRCVHATVGCLDSGKGLGASWLDVTGNVFGNGTAIWNTTGGGRVAGNLMTGSDPWLVGTANAWAWSLERNGVSVAQAPDGDAYGVMFRTDAGGTYLKGPVSQRSVSLTLGNGPNDNVVTPPGALISIIGPTAAFSISGLTGGNDGRELRLWYAGTQTLTLKNEVDSASANQISTLTGGPVAIVGPCVVELFYDAASSRWKVIGHNP